MSDEKFVLAIDEGTTSTRAIVFNHSGQIVAVGMLIVSIGASLGGPTGYAINPARDLAPRIAHAVLPIKGKGDSDWGYAWVPVVGPMIGAVLAALTYSIFW